ncbi:hypothetical protein N7476_000350 [Penicillium atrosanguineum]|uniref:Uncharacterized protein n=1 Tax=Penicillium atrosanguineum TaxID=1132637 RepID=A0A9W9QBD3_9EURO|nr:hypothetical protein N7476_000350 [Penicillium atrosanguineum]
MGVRESKLVIDVLSEALFNAEQSRMDKIEVDLCEPFIETLKKLWLHIPRATQMQITSKALPRSQRRQHLPKYFFSPVNRDEQLMEKVPTWTHQPWLFFQDEIGERLLQIVLKSGICNDTKGPERVTSWVDQGEKVNELCEALGSAQQDKYSHLGNLFFLQDISDTRIKELPRTDKAARDEVIQVFKDRIKVSETDRLSLERLANEVITTVWKKVQESISQSDLEWDMRQIEFPVQQRHIPPHRPRVTPAPPIFLDVPPESLNTPTAQHSESYNIGSTLLDQSLSTESDKPSQVMNKPTPHAQPYTGDSNAFDSSVSLDPPLTLSNTPFTPYAQSYNAGSNAFNSIMALDAPMAPMNPSATTYGQSYNAGSNAFESLMEAPLSPLNPSTTPYTQSYNAGSNAFELSMDASPAPLDPSVIAYAQSYNAGSNAFDSIMALDPPLAPTDYSSTTPYTQSYNAGSNAFESLMEAPLSPLNPSTTPYTPYTQSYNAGSNAFDSIMALDAPMAPMNPSPTTYGQSYNAGSNVFDSSTEAPLSPLVPITPYAQSYDAGSNIFRAAPCLSNGQLPVGHSNCGSPPLSIPETPDDRSGISTEISIDSILQGISTQPGVAERSSSHNSPCRTTWIFAS